MNNSSCTMLTANEKKDAEQISLIFKKLIKKEFKKKKPTKKTFGFHGKASKKAKGRGRGRGRGSKRGGATVIGVVGASFFGILTAIGFKSMAMKVISALLYVLVYTFIISYYYNNSPAFYSKVSGDFIDTMTPYFMPELAIKNMTISDAVSDAKVTMLQACDGPKNRAFLDAAIKSVQRILTWSTGGSTPTDICRIYEDAHREMKRKEEDMIRKIANYIAESVGNVGAATTSQLFTPRAYTLFIKFISSAPRVVPILRPRPYNIRNYDSLVKGP